MPAWVTAIIIIMVVCILFAIATLKDKSRGADCLMGIEIVIAFFIIVIGLFISAVIAITKFLL